jgi:chitodextrinase
MIQLSYEQARQYRRIIEQAAATLSDEQALAAPMLFPHWQQDTSYIMGDRLYYEGTLYKVLQDHTSQTSWTPDVTSSLYATVLIPNPEIIPDWVQPDSTNAYMIGDKVQHLGKIWESLVNNNVWEPGTVGTETLWSEVIE